MKELQNYLKFPDYEAMLKGWKHGAFGSLLCRVERSTTCAMDSKQQRLDCVGQCWYTDTVTKK